MGKQDWRGGHQRSLNISAPSPHCPPLLVCSLPDNRNKIYFLNLNRLKGTFHRLCSWVQGQEGTSWLENCSFGKYHKVCRHAKDHDNSSRDVLVTVPTHCAEGHTV